MPVHKLPGQDEEICPYCGDPKHEAKCPLVTAIEYYPDETIKRVEFRARNRDAIVRVGGQVNVRGIENLASLPERKVDLARAGQAARRQR